VSVPEALAWLEVSADSKSPSTAQIYASAILEEFRRMAEQLDICARELDTRERLREEALAAHRSVEASFGDLEESARTTREEWDQARTGLETRLKDTAEKLLVAEGSLKDVHYALLNQPELKREEIASAIATIVTPYPPGEKSPEGDPYLWESGT
jgi:hypothetical protein